MYRLAFTAVVVLWLTAMSALFVRDVWPAWSAQDPPAMTQDRFARLARNEQFAIRDGKGNLIGRAWGVAIVSTSGNTELEGTILLDGLTLVPVVLIESRTEFDKDGKLDSFNLDVFGVPMTVIRVHGEERGIYFPCEIQVGPLHRQANLDMSASRMIGESMRPFSVLPKLRVGQSWRMQLLDPVSAVVSRKAEFTSVVARVTGKEMYQPEGSPPVECYVVETWPQQSRAWVAEDGRVLRQEVQVPALGRLTVTWEPYDPEARRDAKARIRTDRRTDRGQDGSSD